MANRLLLAAARSDYLRRHVQHGRLSRRAALRFVAGDDFDEAAPAIEELVHRGLLASVNLLGEHTSSEAQAAAALREYTHLLHALDDRGIAAGTDVSVKLSALGLEIAESLALDHLRQICATAESIDATVTVDMEAFENVEAVLRLVDEARRRHPSLGVVVQAYLRRTLSDCESLTSSGSRVRLCKGAYAAPVAVAFDDGDEVRESFEKCLDILMRGAGYPMVATHDPQLVSAARSSARSCNRGPSEFELQMLYGVRPDEQMRLSADGCRVRVYIPYGSHWYAYLVRRIAERPANLAFAVRAVLSRS